MSETYLHLAVLDFEATCEDRKRESSWDPSMQEIIEIPVGLVDLSRRAIVAEFGSFVRPTLQPQLTEFCTELTSIRQSDVDASPTIAPVIESLTAWLAEHGATARNTLMVTCGDWDLKTMWPRQVALSPGLTTPEVFRTWCNIKRIYARCTGNGLTGMMGMMRTLGLRHEGHHHRGADDVRNLCRLALALVEKGARFEATFAAKERRREHRFWGRKVEELETALQAKVDALAELPDGLPEAAAAPVRTQFAERIRWLEEELRRHRAMAAVFAAGG